MTELTPSICRLTCCIDGKSIIFAMITYDVGDDGAITKDMQTVGVSTSIIYTFNEDEAENFVRNYTKSSLDNFFKSNMKTSLKVVIGKYG